MLGPDQAVIRLSVELSFDQTAMEVTEFNPSSQIAIAEDRSEESSAEAGTKERTTTNYEINKTVRHITGAVGAIKRISASLTVNENVPIPGDVEDEVQYRERTPEEMTQVAEIVRGAVGLDETGRSDQLKMSKFPFAITDLRAQAEIKQKKAEQDELITSVVLNVGKAIAIVIALLVLRAIIGAIGRGVAREEEIAMEAQRELEEEEVAEELPETPHELLLGRIAQLISLTDDPKSSARQVAQLISTDQALTAKILKVANSAFYGFPREISTVQLAIVVLGFEQVKNLSLSVAVLRRFSSGKEHRLFDRQRFWDHAIACGVAGRMLARKVHPRMEGEAFVAGVLHDIGKLILIEYFFDEFSEALELAEAEELTIVEAEEQVLGVTHSDIGGWLAEKWNLPPSLVSAIAFHHRPAELEEPDELVHFVHLANALVRHHHIGTSGDGNPTTVNPEIADRFKPDPEMTIEELLDHLSSGLDAELEKAQIFKDLGDS